MRVAVGIRNWFGLGMRSSVWLGLVIALGFGLGLGYG